MNEFLEKTIRIGLMKQDYSFTVTIIFKIVALGEVSEDQCNIMLNLIVTFDLYLH